MRQALGETMDGAVQLLNQLVAQFLQPVIDPLEQARRQQLGLHRVLMQVAARIQEQIDQQRAEGGRIHMPMTLRSDEIDKAFDRTQEGRASK